MLFHGFSGFLPKITPVLLPGCSLGWAGCETGDLGPEMLWSLHLALQTARGRVERSKQSLQSVLPQHTSLTWTVSWDQQRGPWCLCNTGVHSQLSQHTSALMWSGASVPTIKEDPATEDKIAFFSSCRGKFDGFKDCGAFHMLSF